MVSVTYTAECHLNAGTGSYIFITILIDNQPMTPTGPGDAFCSGRSGAVGGGAARRSITVSRTLLGGFIHQMRIFAQVSGTHTGARIGASTLVVAQ